MLHLVRFTPFALVASFLFSTVAAAQSFWQPTNGPYGGQVYSLTETQGVVYAGLFGGVFRSTDGGLGWSYDGLFAATVLAMASDSTGRVYAGTQNGVAYTIDGGTTWRFSAGLSQPIIHAVCPGTEQQFAGGNGGVVMHSTDGGANWLTVHSGTFFNTDVNALLMNRGGTLFAGTFGNGVWKSVDSGVTWTQTGAEVSSGVVCLALDTATQTMYAGTNGKVFSSTNGGTSWTDLNLPENTTVHALWYDPAGKLIAATESGVYSWSSAGGGWTALNTGLKSLDVRAFVPSADRLRWFVSTNGEGVFRSTNGGTLWTQVGLPSPTVFTMGVSGNRILAGTNDSMFVSTDQGNNWQRSNNGLTAKVITSMAFDAPGSAVVGVGTNNGVFVSTNAGAAWLDLTSNLPVRGVEAIACLPNGTVLAGTGLGLFSASLLSPTWTEVNLGVVSPGIYCITALPTGVTFVGTLASGLLRSTDGGATWGVVQVSPSQPTVHAVVKTPLGTLIAGAESEPLFRSIDGGTTWTPCTNGIPQGIGLWTLGLMVAQNGWIYAGVTDSGVYVSSDDGVTWRHDATGISNGTVYALTEDAAAIYAGTRSGGVNRSAKVINPGVHDGTMPGVDALHVWPNPTVEIITIDLAGEVDGRSVRIVDRLGRTFDAGRLSFGEHSLTISLPDALPTGVYACRFGAGNGLRTVPFTVLR